MSYDKKIKKKLCLYTNTNWDKARFIIILIFIISFSIREKYNINANQKIISREPVIVKCPHCNQTGVTSVKKENGVFVYLSAVICCVVGMGPCALVPCCIKDLKDCVHSCTYCGNVVATVRRHENL